MDLLLWFAIALLVLWLIIPALVVTAVRYRKEHGRSIWRDAWDDLFGK
jgi:hypothetical protein